MNQNVIIIGASGHGKVVADIIRCSGDHVLGFLDDRTDITQWVGAPLLGKVSDYVKYTDTPMIIAIGNQDIRQRIAETLTGVRWYTAIHPHAVIAADASVGEGSAVMACCILNSGAEAGRHCIINTGAIIEHDCRIADYAHISVGAKVAGTVSIGRKTWVGIGATVSNNLSICENTIIGAGAVVVRPITEPGTYVGVPVRRIK